MKESLQKPIITVNIFSRTSRSLHTVLRISLSLYKKNPSRLSLLFSYLRVPCFSHAILIATSISNTHIPERLCIGGISFLYALDESIIFFLSFLSFIPFFSLRVNKSIIPEIYSTSRLNDLSYNSIRQFNQCKFLWK